MKGKEEEKGVFSVTHPLPASTNATQIDGMCCHVIFLLTHDSA